LKSTVIRNRLTFLLLDILLDNFIRNSNSARAYCKISPCLKMRVPKLFFQVLKFGEQDTRAYPFEPLHNLADILGWAIGNEHMDMITGNLSGDNFNFVFQGNLPQYVPSPDCNRPCQYRLSVFRNPHQMDFQVRFCMSSKLIKSHSDTI